LATEERRVGGLAGIHVQPLQLVILYFG
jgi:hypothetical protein